MAELYANASPPSTTSSKARLNGLLDNLQLLAEGRPLHSTRAGSSVRLALLEGVPPKDTDIPSWLGARHTCMSISVGNAAGGYGSGLVPPAGLHAALWHQRGGLHPGPGLRHCDLCQAVRS